MKPILTLLLCLLLHSTTKAQTDTSNLSAKYTAIKWATHSLLWPGHFMQLGVEKRVGKYAGQVQFGISVPLKYDIVDTINNPSGSLSGIYSGFTIRAEARKYYKSKRKSETADFFIAGEIFYTQYQQEFGGGYIGDNYNSGYYDKYLLNKSMLSFLTLKTGIQKRFWKHFLIEGYFGIGVKIKKVEPVGRYNIEDRSSKIDFNFGEPIFGTNASLSGPINFSIGYFF